MCFLLIIILAGCSKDEESEIAPITYSSENHSILNSNASLYKEIMGEWKLVKTIPEGNTLIGVDYMCFYSDSIYTYHFVPDSKTYQGKFEIIERDNWEVPTIDYKHLPTNYWLKLVRQSDYSEDPWEYPFVIENNKMHINLGGWTYSYTAYMFERVK